MNGTYVKSAIVAEVWLGMNSGAKNSLDRPGNYLDLARATGKIDLRPLHNVISIEYDEVRQLSYYCLIFFFGEILL
jgi:cholesterol oxidase